jgi:hypothetical protein
MYCQIIWDRGKINLGIKVLVVDQGSNQMDFIPKFTVWSISIVIISFRNSFSIVIQYFLTDFFE